MQLIFLAVIWPWNNKWSCWWPWKQTHIVQLSTGVISACCFCWCQVTFWGSSDTAVYLKWNEQFQPYQPLCQQPYCSTSCKGLSGSRSVMTALYSLAKGRILWLVCTNYKAIRMHSRVWILPVRPMVGAHCKREVTKLAFETTVCTYSALV